jgi:cystathionine beta-lyase/cystathionine gamma-synthase
MHRVLIAISLGGIQGYEYSRSGNPTRDRFEEAVAALEGGKYGVLRIESPPR